MIPALGILAVCVLGTLVLPSTFTIGARVAEKLSDWLNK